MNRDETYKLITSWTKNKNLIKHMLAVEAEMRALAKYFSEDEEKWGLAGLIHDADYEKWPKEHPLKAVEELEKRKAPEWLINAVKSHAWGYQKGLPEPKGKMEWALYTCDELSGFIIAVTLVRPEKKLSKVKVSSILKKWKEKSFARGVERHQVEMCEEKLGIKFKDFVEICLKALQNISDELGL